MLTVYLLSSIYKMDFFKTFTKKKADRGPGSDYVKNQTRKWQNKVDKKK
jgi:hypothetical protein